MALPDDLLDGLTRLAGRVASAPMASVALVRSGEPVVRSRSGFPASWSAHAEAALARLRHHVGASGQPAMAANTGDPDGEIGAYLGAPLVASDGGILGTVCVFDRRPRAWRPEQVAALVDLAAVAARLVEAEGQAAASAGDREIEHLKSDLLMTVAHDLAQPLQVVKGQAQLLRRRLASGAALDRDAVAAALAQIETSAQLIAAEVAEMLDIGHARPGWRPTLRYGSADLVVVVRQAVAAQQGASATHAVALATDEVELVGIVDAARIRRALDNVLDNAVKYSPAGGAVILTLEREDAVDGPVAVVAVRDSGIGIPAADVPRVAERFFRAANAVGVFHGTGIGLAGARQTLEAHGGQLTIESTEGVGTVVTLRLPLTLGLASEEPARRGAPERPAARDGGAAAVPIVRAGRRQRGDRRR